MIIMVWQDANDQRVGHDAHMFFVAQLEWEQISLKVDERESEKARRFKWFRNINVDLVRKGENVETLLKQRVMREEWCPRIIDDVENVSDFHLKENCFYDDGDSFWYWKYYLKIY